MPKALAGFNPATLQRDPSYSSHPVCLVDHNQRTQLADGVVEDNIKGIIDHHALKSAAVSTSGPINMILRPWGSACTIISYLSLVKLKRRPSKGVAGMLLSGILSDTLNLKGPTTTPMDRCMVAALSKIAGVGDINELAKFQFKAKTDSLMSMTDTEIVLGDHKVYQYVRDGGGTPFKVGFGVVECVGEAPTRLLERKRGLLAEITALKSKDCKDLTFSFLAIVNVEKLTSVLLIPSEAEGEVARRAFKGEINFDGTVMNMGNRVSRKLDFIKQGIDPILKDPKFSFPRMVRKHTSQREAPSAPLVMDCSMGCCGKITREFSMRGTATTVLAAVRFKKGMKICEKCPPTVPTIAKSSEQYDDCYNYSLSFSPRMSAYIACTLLGALAGYAVARVITPKSK